MPTPNDTREDAPLTASVENGAIVISIGVNTLAWCWEKHPDNVDDHGEYRSDWNKVVDAEEFARDVVRALTQESEDGTNDLHRLFDKAMIDACEDGSLGLMDIDDMETADDA